jgi:phospholipase C
MISSRSAGGPSGTLKCGAMMLTALLVLGTFPQSANAEKKSTAPPTPKSPIQHVVIIIGENRTFDHVFGTYVPKANPVTGDSQYIWNLWSEGIVNLDGTPGPNFKNAQQFSASDTTTYQISPTTDKTAYTALPPSMTGGAPTAGTFSGFPFLSEAVGKIADPDLARGYDRYLTTGATGLPTHSIDTRIRNAAAPANGPYQLTGPHMPYDAYTSSPVHRLFQMWQQTDCNVSAATTANPSGCQNDLFPWVEVTVGAGTNGLKQKTPFTDETTGEGSTSMAFYNINEGDVPYFKALADNYAINDNFHQSVMGGTGANHIMFGFGDAIYYTQYNQNTTFAAGTPPKNEVEDVDPQETTNNWYKEDGYGDYDSAGNPYGGGSYVDCANLSEGGVPAIVNYLDSISIKSNCQSGHYYLVNNYNPGYLGDGTVAPVSGSSPEAYAFTIPPTDQKSIGDLLTANDLSWTYYGEGWDLYVADPTDSNPFDQYCNICNPFQYQAQVMGNPTATLAHIADESQLFEDIDANMLPAVSVIKPSGYNDGHPASSKLDLFEGFTKKIIDAIQANPTLWASTAIFITEDEGGGYYDSGYIQPVDFFGDGTRIPLIVVSPYSRGGWVNHQYSDHVSLDKFIERNWGLKNTISSRSRDRFPDPIQPANSDGSPSYAPTNSPAIDDLWSIFTFPTSPSARPINHKGSR